MSGVKTNDHVSDTKDVNASAVKGVNSICLSVRLFGALFFIRKEYQYMDTRIAIVGIIIENLDASAQINDILHQYAQYIIGRMGLPYRSRGLNIISVVVEAPQNIISALSGKLGMLPDVSTKTIYSKNIPADEE